MLQEECICCYFIFLSQQKYFLFFAFLLLQKVPTTTTTKNKARVVGVLSVSNVAEIIYFLWLDFRHVPLLKYRSHNFIIITITVVGIHRVVCTIERWLLYKKTQGGDDTRNCDKGRTDTKYVFHCAPDSYGKVWCWVRGYSARYNLLRCHYYDSWTLFNQQQFKVGL